MKKRTLWFMLILILFCMLKESWASPIKVYVSIPPQKWLCEKLGGEHLITGVLLKKGQDPHTFEPTPKQMVNLYQAQLYFALGLEFEKQIIQKINSSLYQLKVIDTVEGHDEKGDTGHNHLDEHAHVGEDPHVWLSLPIMMEIAETMAEALIMVDPDNAGMYRENLGALTKELVGLHHEIESRLAPYTGRAFYVFHPSFGHFARTYGLVQETVEIQRKKPSPRQLGALIQQARRDNVKVIFSQPQFDNKSARAIARAIDGEVITLDALAENMIDNLRMMSVKIEKALER